MSFGGQDVGGTSGEYINRVMAIVFCRWGYSEFCAFPQESIMEVIESQELVKRYLHGLEWG